MNSPLVVAGLKICLLEARHRVPVALDPAGSRFFDDLIEVNLIGKASRAFLFGSGPTFKAD